MISKYRILKDTLQYHIMKRLQVSGRTIFAPSIEEPVEEFAVAWNWPTWKSLPFGATVRWAYVRAQTAEGALRIARYHHPLGRKFRFAIGLTDVNPGIFRDPRIGEYIAWSKDGLAAVDRGYPTPQACEDAAFRGGQTGALDIKQIVGDTTFL
jgi:hypothetical protein